ncbi:MAG TPA: hypothetical protein VF665_22135, partial [Longimicrobium sp.]|uniref:hypothetical protein n=1 Tax=Longimicrobium sp. TaxID=2029185 RepID=UPI002EDA0735
MDTMTMRERPSVQRTVCTVGYLWLMAALPTGTAVLLGPAGWVTNALHSRGWGQNAEDLVMKGVILAFVVGSLMIALALAAATLRAERRRVRIGIPVFVTALCALSLWGWMDPNRMMAAVAGGGQHGEALTSENGAQFLFGAYPDKARLAALKKQGYTAVVSLQHP